MNLALSTLKVGAFMAQRAAGASYPSAPLQDRVCPPWESDFAKDWPAQAIDACAPDGAYLQRDALAPGVTEVSR